jgi:ferritin-like protein
MAGGSSQFHESPTSLSPRTLDRHRALTSLVEELEAVDWYDQRIDATGDTALAAILTHNRDEEKEHAAMLLEWLRREDAVIDGFLRRYLFTSSAIVDSGDLDDTEPSIGLDETSLAIGGLREKEML